jgi:hypothetical protein
MTVFLPGAHLVQTLKMDGKQSGFDFRRYQACIVEVLEMGLIFGPEARKFHPREVIERRQPSGHGQTARRPDGWLA